MKFKNLGIVALSSLIVGATGCSDGRTTETQRYIVETSSVLKINNLPLHYCAILRTTYDTNTRTNISQTLMYGVGSKNHDITLDERIEPLVPIVARDNNGDGFFDEVNYTEWNGLFGANPNLQRPSVSELENLARSIRMQVPILKLKK